MGRRAGLLLAVVAVAAAGYVVLIGDEGGDSEESRSRSAPAPEAQATCQTGGFGVPAARPLDAVLGPMVLLGGRNHETRPPDAFDGHGYKIPVTLPEGTAATLSVPPAQHSRVGLVFSLDTQRRVQARGVAGADRAVRFTACPAEGAASRRTGWGGGFVVDRRRCATLVLTVAGGDAPERHRVPLGRPC